MFDTIKKFFEANLAPTEADSNTAPINRIELACAALLIEVMNSDYEQDSRELAELVDVLKTQLQLDPATIDEVVRLAKSRAIQATSLYEFTELVNTHYNYEQKLLLIENMWRIAFSDQQLDRYEDHLIRKVAELIYVSHSDFIRTKLKIRDSA